MRDAKKKNILIVHNYYQIPGGEDTVVENEKKMLEKRGHKVVFYSRNNSELEQTSIFHKLSLPFTTVFNVRTYFDIKRIIKKYKIEIVHVHNTLTLISPAVYYAALSMNIPVVQTIHNFRLLCPGATLYREGHICEECIDFNLKCAVKHNCYRNNKLQTLACVINTYFHRMTGIYRKINYICLTEFNKEKLLRLNKPSKKKLVNPDKVYIKPNFTYQGVAHKGNDYYLFIGRIEDIKGIKIVIDAFSKLPQYQLKIAGTGTKLEYYKKYAEKLENVEFLGFIDSRESLNKAISKACALIVSSQWYETFGMVIIEAYSNHVPVISGDIGNIGILVEDGVTGYKFKYNSVENLINTIKKFENNLNSETLSNNAFDKYENDFSEEKNYKMLLDIYNSLKI